MICELEELKTRAEQGSPQAQYELAMRYIYANGVEEDHPKAACLLEQAAEQGHREAAYNLGICYHYGYGVEVDLKTAYQLYLRSALQGYGKGFTLVGDFYADGICVRQNVREAIKWYLDATVSEDPEAAGYAEYKLAGFLARGCGVEQDLEQAVQWYEKALAHGELRAKAALAELGYYDSFRIRPCRVEDAGEICRLNQTLLGRSEQEDLPERLQRLLDDPAHRIFVAVAEGRVTGYIHGCDHESLLDRSQKRVAAMAVEQTGIGIEQALLEKLFRWAEETGCQLVVCRERLLEAETCDWKTLFG